MINIELLLSAVDAKEKTVNGGIRQPDWICIEEKIERAINLGGFVQLFSIERIGEREDQFVIIESIHITAKPGRFRLIVLSRQRPGERQCLREWWESGDAPYRGSEVFNDTEWDLRSVCTDIKIALTLFKEFFEHRGISSLIDNQTRLV